MIPANKTAHCHGLWCYHTVSFPRVGVSFRCTSAAVRCSNFLLASVVDGLQCSTRADRVHYKNAALQIDFPTKSTADVHKSKTTVSHKDDSTRIYFPSEETLVKKQCVKQLNTSKWIFALVFDVHAASVWIDWILRWDDGASHSDRQQQELSGNGAAAPQFLHLKTSILNVLPFFFFLNVGPIPRAVFLSGVDVFYRYLLYNNLYVIRSIFLCSK